MFLVMYVLVGNLMFVRELGEYYSLLCCVRLSLYVDEEEALSSLCSSFEKN